ncbi:hypothetical protein Tco_0941989 [Tanacetum coccineum]|uniref:RNA-directed DNA polymerase, eukaryota, Reverse transcriptase zinc-binding domain protein n=1 Tax=Tanacetum coccineum TaxID=301880 RepID=A0ABQ5DTE1_9ASTR
MDVATWKALLGMKYKVRPFLFTVGNGKDIAMWSDNWCTIGHLSQYISNRMLFDARIKESYGLVDMIDNGSWNWPEEWLQQVPMLINIHVSRLNKHDNDYVKWMNSEEDNGMYKITITKVTCEKVKSGLQDWPWEGSVFDGCNRECVKDESSWSTQNTDKGG